MPVFVHKIFLFAAVAVTLLTVSQGQIERLELPEESERFNAANECKDIIIPKNLCRTCPLRSFDSEGNFNTSYKKDIYDYDAPGCLDQIRNYVNLNPCDTVRKRYLDTFQTNSFSRQRIAQFLYVVCEQCCDCVPQGAKVSEYLERKQDNTLHKYSRGNCPAHFHYDVCKLFPENRRFIGENWVVRNSGPPICPMVKEWIDSDFSTWWAANPDAAGLNKTVLNAFRRMVVNTKCRSRKVWADCVRLEKAQGRI